MTGADDFIAYVSEQAQRAPADWAGAAWFILRISEDCANVQLQDVWRPRRFLGQMAGLPPLRFGTEGFDPELVDDLNPARHYIAFVFVGFWLPQLLAVLLLWLWEVAGFIRYKGEWSQRDIVCGQIGLRHGRLVNRYGAVVLPSLIAADLTAKSPQTSPIRVTA